LAEKSRLFETEGGNLILVFLYGVGFHAANVRLFNTPKKPKVCLKVRDVLNKRIRKKQATTYFLTGLSSYFTQLNVVFNTFNTL